jgi:hypothetical protein
VFATRVLSNTPLRQVEGGYLIDIRLPWYRALPVSTVSIAALSVDGVAIDLATIKLALSAREMATYKSRWWYVLDSAYLFVPGKLALDTPHRVAVTVGIRPPYIPGFYRLTECDKTLSAEAA